MEIELKTSARGRARSGFFKRVDPLTHSLLGLTCGLVAAPRGHRRAAALAGLVAGQLPDADVFLRSKVDPLFNLEYHRHFTHSLVFSPVVAALAAGVAAGLYSLFKKRVPWAPLLFPAWLSGLLHIFCDIWTSYGTRAWWPFSDARVSLDWISVIDPVFTVPLAACAALAVRYASKRAAVTGLAWACVYLTFCVVQQQRARSAFTEYLANTGQPAPERLTLKPSFGNALVWRAISVSDGKCQVAAIRCGIFSGRRVIPGESAKIFPSPEAAASALRVPPDTTQARDIARFFHFSDGWVGPHPDDPLVLGDLRYASLPDAIRPLWGVRVSPPYPDQHVEFLNFRQNIGPSVRRLRDMVRGRF